MPHGIRRIIKGHAPTIQVELSSIAPVSAKNRSKHLRSTGTDQSGKSHNFAIVQLK